MTQMTDLWADYSKDVNLISGISSSLSSSKAHLVEPSHTAGVDNDVTASTLLPLTSSLQEHTYTHIHKRK